MKLMNAVLVEICKVHHQLHEVRADEGPRGISVTQVSMSGKLSLNKTAVESTGRNMRTSLIQIRRGHFSKGITVPTERRDLV